MFNVGLLVLKGTKLTIEQKLPKLLSAALSKVNKKLYVKLNITNQNDLIELVQIVYQNASKIQNDIDLRVLLNRKKQILIDQLFEEKNEDELISIERVSKKKNLYLI